MRIKSLLQRNLSRISKAQLFKGLCLLCRQPTDADLICSWCSDELPILDHYCYLCGTPLAGHATKCGVCIASPPVWDRLHILADYEFPLQGLIHTLKYQRNPLPAHLLGKLLADMYQHNVDDSERPEVILPVPLHWRRQWKRGFNQCQELARPITQQLGIPCRIDILKRTRHTSVQAGLSKTERHSNLLNAFTINSHSFKHVILLDDVVTTGTTVATLVQLLKASGCERVDVWAICRTQLRGE